MAEVILLEKINGKGEIGSVIEFADGYVYNYLIPNKKVLLATPEHKIAFEKQKAIREEENQKKITLAKEMAANINPVNVVIYKQAGEDGKMYGSVTKKDIIIALTAKAIDVTSDQLNYNNKIKTIGNHVVDMILHPEVLVKINITVSRLEEK